VRPSARLSMSKVPAPSTQITDQGGLRRHTHHPASSAHRSPCAAPSNAKRALKVISGKTFPPFSLSVPHPWPHWESV